VAKFNFTFIVLEIKPEKKTSRLRLTLKNNVKRNLKEMERDGAD
jgi:hypothetical protein